MQRTVSLIIKLCTVRMHIRKKGGRTNGVKFRESTPVVQASRDTVESHLTHEILR